MRRVAAVIAAFLLAACGSDDPAGAPASETEAATPAPATEATEPPATEPSEAPETAAPPAGTQDVDVYFVRDAVRGVYVEPVAVELAEPTVAVARAAIEHLVTADPDDPGLVNLVPDGTEVLDVDLDGETLVVDLDLPDDQLGLGAAFEQAAVQQLVHTGAQFPTVARVQLLEEGEPLPSGHADFSEPVEPDEFAISPIVITEPEHGASVPVGDVTVSGTANTFEATVGLQLLGPDGAVVDETFTTATCGTGCRGTWEHTFTGLDEPGTWIVVATEDDASDGEGGGPFWVQREIVVD